MGLLDGKLTGVTALIGKFGSTVSIRRLREGTYSTATQTFTPAESSGVSPMTVSGVWWGADPIRLPENGVVQPNDRFVLVDASGLAFNPEKGDLAEFSGVQYTVISCQPITTGGAIAAYQLQVRQ